MDTSVTKLSYSDTGFFSALLIDYINGDEKLRPFYSHPVSVKGIRSAISERRQFNTERKLLVELLKDQYKDIKLTKKQEQNLNSLADENTFTVCTAHQPNIFTGHLYFIYKILHAIKLAEKLTTEIEGAHFVPVYYMGSEDADLDELGHVYIEGKRLEWKTKQTGSVGRMMVDKGLLQLIEEIDGQLSVQKHGKEIIHILRDCYRNGVTIEQATFKFVNTLFARFGLIILLPDRADVKRLFTDVIEKELDTEFSHEAVQETLASFPRKYKIQTSGREINLFYLTNHARERIQSLNGHYSIVDNQIILSREQILIELKEHPERFSPNVILRPVLQETVLPNVAFIGGGGEIAYWLELKKVFNVAGVPYPVLVTRNSFLLIEDKYKKLVDALKIKNSDLFKSENDLLKMIVKRESHLQLSLEKEKQQMAEIYENLKRVSGDVDNTLRQHTEALQVKALKKIDALEKKLLKAEKAKYEAQQRQLHKIKEQLFPNNSLQERVENFMSFYARWGSGFIDMLYSQSPGLEQEFSIVHLND